MRLSQHPWIVRILTYTGTGILVAAAAMTIVGTAMFLLWGLATGPLWLQWAIGIPLILALLTHVGRSFYRKEI